MPREGRHSQAGGFVVSYTMLWEPKGVYKHFAGFLSFQEYARSQEEVLGDSRVDDIRYVINDLLDIEGYAVAPEQAEYAAAFNRASALSNPRIRIAYVTNDKRLALLVKVVGALSAYELRVFPSLAEARSWACEGSSA